MKTLLTIILACCSIYASAQVDESKNFVYFYSDSVHYAKNIRPRTTLFNSINIRANSRSFPLNQVKFFQNIDGFFANTSRLKSFRTEGLSKRMIEGKVNLYREREFKTFSYNDDFDYHHYTHNNSNAIDVRMFYNKGYDDLKKVNYKNLSVDMADDQQAIDLLKGYNQNIRTSRILYVASGASLIGSLVAFLAHNKNNRIEHDFSGFGPNSNPPNMDIKYGGFPPVTYALLGASIGFAAVGYTINISGLKKLERSIETYNR